MMRNVKPLRLYQHSCHVNDIHTFIIYESDKRVRLYQVYLGVGVVLLHNLKEPEMRQNRCGENTTANLKFMFRV
jgi:hypothetical protein